MGSSLTYSCQLDRRVFLYDLSKYSSIPLKKNRKRTTYMPFGRDILSCDIPTVRYILCMRYISQAKCIYNRQRRNLPLSISNLQLNKKYPPAKQQVDIYYLISAIVTPFSPSPKVPRRNVLIRGSPFKNWVTPARRAPVPLP